MIQFISHFNDKYTYLDSIRLALEGGCRWIQLRMKDATDEEIEEALRTASAWDFVKELPDGINSKLSDSGRGISMGQGQRVSIARALLRNSPIVLLDEATSSLDVDTERELLQNIIKKQPNKTYIISTHRPSVINQASSVYRIIDKKIVKLSREDIDGIIRQYTEDNRKTDDE